MRIEVSVGTSASTDCSVSAGILSNAELTGVNTVNGPAPFSVSPRLAAVTAATSVDSSGLLLAAVPTGSSAMPLTLPSPSAGTAAQSGPVGPAIAAVGAIGVDGGVEADTALADTGERQGAMARAPIARDLGIMDISIV